MIGLLALLRRAPKPAEEGEPEGADERQLERLRAVLGFDLPAEVAEWLRLCNGCYVGRGGLYGTEAIVELYELYPRWLVMHWIPVAGDEHGNTYIVDAGRRHLDADAVFFVDAMRDVDRPAFVVASSLSRFLAFLFEKELGASGWPFDRCHLTAHDPAVLAVQAELLPWSDPPQAADLGP